MGNLGKVMGVNWGLGDFFAGFQVLVILVAGVFFVERGRPDRRGVPGLYRLQLHAGVALSQPGPPAGGAEQDLYLRHPPVRHLRRPRGAELPPPGQAPYGRGTSSSTM